MHRKESKLLNAAKLNKFEDVRKILDKIDKAKLKRKSKGNIDIDVKDSTGTTALHHAAKHGNIEMMIFLVSRGADIESIDQIGWRPISYACANNCQEAVKTLIQWKSNVNKFSLMEENSPLHIAAGLGYVDIVKMLMDRGANVHCQNKKKQTPMDVACENNHYGVVNALLSASSKLIEDTSSKPLTINSLVPSISLSRSSLFIKSASINNSNHLMSRLKTGTNVNGDFEMKRRTIGSQSQLCTPMELPTPKKSGSLNTVFLKDSAFDESDQKKEDDLLKENRENKFNHSGIEVNLPYPSKFSTSEKLKIKSPLLATKNWRLAEKIRHNNPSVIETFYPEQYSAKFIYPSETQKSPSVEHIPQNRSITNRRPLSSSTKELLSKQSSMNCISNPHMNASFMPPYSAPVNFSSDLDQKLTSHGRKFQSIRRGFESESELPISPIRKENSQQKPAIAIKPKINHAYTRSPSLQEYISQKTEKDTSNEKQSENQEKWTCHQWIKSIGLERIWDTMFKEGFESFLSLSLATDEELLLLCDNNIEDWDSLKRNLELLKIPSISQLQFSIKISDMLFQLGLDCYANNFYVNGYIHTQQAAGFDEKDLNKLHIYKIGHRKLILSCFGVDKVENCISEKSNSPISVEAHVPNANDLESSPNQFNSLPNLESNNYLNVVMRKKPPPIPSRSSSILDGPNEKSFTLDDILVASNTDESTNDKQNETEKSTIVDKTSSLDDIVGLLENLGKELDLELDNI